MTFYIFLYILCVLFLIINNKLTVKKDKGICIGILLISLCIISGTRYHLGGSDYWIYRTVYNNSPQLFDFIKNFNTLDSKYMTFGFERGYLFINSFFKTFDLNFYAFTLIEAIFFYFCMYFGLKKYVDNYVLFIIVFLYKSFFYNTFISMRQSITIALFFIMIRFIQERKVFLYYLFCFLALQFHNAAIVLFLLYPLLQFKLTKKKLILLNIVFIPSILISFFNIPIFKIFDFFVNIFSNPVQMEKAEKLLNGTSLSGINLFHTLEYFLIMGLIIINFEKIIKVDKNSEFIIKLFLCILPIMTLFRNYEILTRCKDYFTFTYAIVLGYLCLIDKGKYRTIVQIGTVGVCAFGFFRFIILFDNGAMIPYISYLTKNVSIFY